MRTVNLKKRVFFLFICTIVLMTSSFSQCGYYFQRMIGNYRFVRFWDEMHGVLLGDNGFMLTTEDGGKSWKEQTIPLFESLMRKPTRSISITGGTHGYIVGSFGNILKTADKGKNWTRLVGINGMEEFTGVHFVNTQVGYVCGQGGVLYKTTDGGLQWQKINPGYSEDLYGLCFSSSERGYVWGRNIVFETTNGGKTWKEAKALPGTNMGRMQFVSASQGFATFTDLPNRIYQTKDSGNTWTPGWQSSTVSTGFHFTNARTFYSGEYGAVYKTVNWAPADGVSIGNFYVSDVFFANENTGFITGVPSGWGNGNGRCLFKTTNAAKTWEKIDYVLLYPSSSSTSGTGVADFMKVNDHKYLLSTSTGEVLTASTSFGPWLPEPALSNANNYMKLGHKGRDFAAFLDNRDLFTSTDDGATWIQKSLNLPDTVHYEPKKETIAWLSKDAFYTTANNYLFYTANQGASWRKVNAPDKLWIKGLKFFSRDTGYMITKDSAYQSVMYRTYDAGANWKKINPWDTVRNGDHFKANYVNDSVFIVLVGYNREVFKTRDRGNTWQKMSYKTSQEIGAAVNDIHFFNEQVGTITNNNWEIYTTRDSGQTWMLQLASLLNHEGLRGIYYASENEMYIRGDYLNLFRFTPYQPQKPSMIRGDTVVLEGTSHEYIIPLNLYAYDSKWSVPAGGKLLYDSTSPERVVVKWTTPGKYRLDVYSKNECGISEVQSLHVKVKSPNEPEEPDSSEEKELCKVFPNPVINQVLHIQFEQTTQLDDIQLYNATGSLLKQTGKRFISNVDISMDQYPAGIYFLKVIPTNKELKPVVKKIINR